MACQYGGMKAPDAKRRRPVKAGNNKLEKLLAEVHLDIHALNTAFEAKR